MRTTRRTYAFKNSFKRRAAGLFDAMGGLFFRLDRPLPPPSEIKKLLIMRLDHLGDVVNVLPLIQQINLLNPKPFLAVCVSSLGAQLLRDTPGIDQWIIFDAPWFSRRSPSSAGLSGYRDLIHQIRAGRFDMSFELRGDLRHHVLLWMSKIQHRIGYGSTGGAFLLTHELEWRPNTPPTESNLTFLTAFGGPPTATAVASLTWTIREQELQTMRKAVPDKDFLLFHIDAGTQAKKWPIDRYRPLLNQAQQRGLKPVLVGSDAALARDHLPQQGNAEIIDMLGRTTLPQLIALISLSRGIVSTDSGPAHIAAAMQKPVLILWSGTSDPAVWKPRGSNIFHVQEHVSCEYCGNEICPLPEQICMTRLTPDKVLPVLEKVLSS